MRRLLVVEGQEGVGKSTLIRALLLESPSSAQIDAEDVGQVNPWVMDDDFIRLLWNNVVACIHNFWAAGYSTVIAGSFCSLAELPRFLALLDGAPEVFVVHVCASKVVRDGRRMARPKRTSRRDRDWVDRHYPEETDVTTVAAEYGYVRVDNSYLSVEDTVAAVRKAFPEIYGALTASARRGKQRGQQLG